MEKAILMNSGGPDCLASAILAKDKYELHSLYINVGLPCHNRSIPVIKRIAEKYCVSHFEMKLEGNWSLNNIDYWDKDFYDKSKVTENAVGVIPHQIHIPGQFLIYHSLAYLYTAHNRIRKIINGCKKEIKGKQQAELLRIAQMLVRWGHIIEFEFPVYDMTNRQITDIVLTDEELKDHTVSCNAENPCHVCQKCDNKVKRGLREDAYKGVQI